jgi:hypothetical protein
MKPFISARNFTGKPSNFYLQKEDEKIWTETPYETIKEHVSRKYTIHVEHKHGKSEARFDYSQDAIRWIKTFKSDARFWLNDNPISIKDLKELLQGDIAVKPTCNNCKHRRYKQINGERVLLCDNKYQVAQTFKGDDKWRIEYNSYLNKEECKQTTDCLEEMHEFKG